MFEYITKNWVRKLDGTLASTMTADTDEPLMNQRAIVLGVKWRMWQIKGFSYGALQQEYLDFVNREAARSGGMPDLRLNKRRAGYLLSSSQVADGYFPGPGGP